MLLNEESEVSAPLNTYGFYSPINEIELDEILMNEDINEPLNSCVVNEIGYGFYSTINEIELDEILLSEESNINEPLNSCVVNEIGYGFYSPINEIELDAMLLDKEPVFGSSIGSSIENKKHQLFTDFGQLLTPDTYELYAPE